MQTKEQQKGKILEKRLILLNDFLLKEKHSGITFNEFLSKKMMTAGEFSKELPEEYQFKDIGNISLTDADSDSEETLKDYIEDLNVLYYEQYLAQQDNLSACGNLEFADLSACNAQGDNACAFLSMCDADGDEFYEAKGDRERRRAEKKAEREAEKAKIKAAKDAKKAEKDRLKALVKSGEMTPQQKRDAMKGVRGKFREEVGSGAGRFVGKLNKFNPAMVLVRNAFNSLLLINMFNMSYNLGRMKDAGGEHWKKVVKRWKVFGGTESALSNNIDKGKGKKPILGRKKSADGEEFYNVAAEVWITAAAGALAVILPEIASFKKEKGEPEIPDENPDLPPAPPMDPETQRALEEAELAKSGGFFEKYKTAIYIGGAVVIIAIIGVIVKIIRKK